MNIHHGYLLNSKALLVLTFKTFFIFWGHYWGHFKCFVSNSGERAGLAEVGVIEFCTPPIWQALLAAGVLLFGINVLSNQIYFFFSGLGILTINFSPSISFINSILGSSSSALFTPEPKPLKGKVCVLNETI